MPELQPISGSAPWAGTPSTAALLRAMVGYVANVPPLPQAACKNQPWMADLESGSPPELIERAKETCRRCPALDACRRWIDSTPKRLRPAGVAAGELMTAARSRPRKCAQESFLTRSARSCPAAWPLDAQPA
jgi:WhiB family transcriptional regulator, redox-sensing transcriptional regulator